MSGTINTKQACPSCGNKFSNTHTDKDGIYCPACRTRPTRYYINGHAFGLGHIYKDPKTNKVFHAYSHAVDVLTTINKDFRAVDEKKRDFLKKYSDEWVPEQILENRIENRCKTWLELYKAELEVGVKSKNRVGGLSISVKGSSYLFSGTLMAGAMIYVVLTVTG